MAMPDLTPSRIGPGLWFALHYQAYHSRTIVEQEVYARFVRRLCKNFPCSQCREHSVTYLHNYPPEDMIGVEVIGFERPQLLGMFSWSWIFHNHVNARLGKPIVCWDAACHLYSSPATLPSMRYRLTGSEEDQNESSTLH